MVANKIFPLTPYLTLIAPGVVLDKRTGAIVSIKNANSQIKDEIVSYFNKENITIQALNSQADVVTSVDYQIIDFYLKTSDGKLTPKDGFLIEVFDSGSDGKLVRLYKEDLQDPVDNNNVIQDGFSNYFTIEVD